MGIRNNFNTMYKGFLVGATMLVPGVSGGSMAMILGIYERLLGSISSFFHDKKKNLCFLLLFVSGAGVGMLLLARPILSLLESYPKPMSYLFLGAVAGGIPAVYTQAQVKKFSWKYFLYILTGFGIVYALSCIPTENVLKDMQTGSVSGIYLVVAGIILATGLVLPGISVSYLLLVMGLYHKMMEAIIELDFLFLVPLGGGVLAGVLLVTKGLEYIMKKYPQITYLVIIGFVIGSLMEVFPGIPIGTEWIFCIATFTAGYYFIHTLSKAENAH